MSITIGSNIASLRGIRQLAKTSNELGTVYERLSSGQRINRASDDAAGLAIASSLNADVRVFAQGVRNINDGLSLLNIAQGATDSLVDIIARQLELTEQAANGTYSFEQRKALNTEANALVSEYNRIIGTTNFLGLNLFENSGFEMQIQAGFSTLEFNLGKEMGRIVGDGTFSFSSTISAGNQRLSVGDLNGDGISDLIIGGYGGGRSYYQNW